MSGNAEARNKKLRVCNNHVEEYPDKLLGLAAVFRRERGRRDREERRGALRRDSLCQERLASPRRAEKQHACAARVDQYGAIAKVYSTRTKNSSF